MTLTPPEKVRKLQETLQAKAKGSPTYRFYALYDKVYRADVLAHAYRCCRANDGTPGVDGQTFEDIEALGVEKWLGELAETLRQKTYRPQAVRRVWIPKPDGTGRPLGIPTIADRVVQTATLLVLGPIFEADLQPEQYAYRPGRSAQEAVRQVQQLMIAGHTEVVDADLSGYFDSIPHAELMTSVARRVSDGALLALLKSWLEAPVEEEASGKKRRTTRHKDERRGTPQGAPLSPLLANIYMRRFILGWKALGHEQRFGAVIVNYADDFVICCRRDAGEALATMRDMMAKLKLTVNETKTRVCRGPAETFDFLGYTIGRCYQPTTGQPYTGVRPSVKALRHIRARLREQTTAAWQQLEPAEMVLRLNTVLRGWGNYFCLGTVTRAYRSVNAHVAYRLRQWMGRKYGVRGTGYRYPYAYLYDTLGLYKLQRRPSHLSCAKA